jgi:tetratricopeptide (TPR) repeat protein
VPMTLRVFSGLFFLLCVLSLSAQSSAAPQDDVVQKFDQAKELQKKGKDEEARKVYESLLPALRARQPSKLLASTLEQLSSIETAAGNYEAGAGWAQAAADVYHKLGDVEGEAQAFNHKGIAEVQRGSYVAAEKDFEKALTEANAANKPETQTQVLNNLGGARYYQGKYLEALRDYDDAMQLVDQASKAEWSDYWRQITNFNRATLYQRLGRYEKALTIYRQVEASSNSLTTNDRAHLLANLGTLYRRLGDPWKALDTFQAAQRLYSTSHDSDGEIAVLKNIGIVYALDLEDLANAQKIFERAQALASKTHNRREEMQAHLYLGETLLRKRSLDEAGKEFERASALANELGTTEEQWKARYGLGQIQDLFGKRREAEAEYRLAIEIIEKSRATLQLSALRAEFFADKRDVYDALIRLLVLRHDVTETFAFLERSRARTFQDRVAGEENGKTNTSPVTLEEVQHRLPADTALIEFWVSSDQVAAIWCRRNAYGMAAKDMSPAEQQQSRAVVDSIAAGSGPGWRDQARSLAKFLPPESYSIWSARHLLIVPDGWLSIVPFDLLPAHQQSNQLLIEAHEISYLPSAVLLRRKRDSRGMLRFPWIQELIAFGNPVKREGSAAPELASPNRGSSSALPASEEEIASIAEMSHGRASVFLGPDDLKRSFFAHANAGPILHVSTHAFADADNPENSRLLFSPEGPKDAIDYVFLRELYDLNLGNVRLATISACDTERGKIVRGEGVQAFSRALLTGGAQASLTTLWRVDDSTTAAFMKQFYFFALQQHKPKAEALRLAKLKFLRSNSRLEDPRYWAGFVLNGDGGTPLPRVLSWSELLLLALIAAGGILLISWLTLRNRRKFDRQHHS